MFVMSTCHAQQRFALIIGNKDYASAPLLNSINDARDINSMLKILGFTTSIQENINAVQMAAGVDKFFAMVEKESEDDSVILVYYAGHAIQIEHHNYLLGINNPLEAEQTSRGLKIVRTGAEIEKLGLGLYDVNHLLSKLPSNGHSQSIVLLDACRNNPFEKLEGEQEIVGNAGLAPMRAPPGTLIGYATEPGNVAADGSGRNGVYTKHLLKHIEKMITVEELFKLVRQGVIAETAKKQIPWEHSSLFEDVFVNPPRNKKMPNLMTF
jgi:uncharacterized caspase-like protein